MSAGGADLSISTQLPRHRDYGVDQVEISVNRP